MHECLLCKRDMKTAITIFGNGCIKSIYKILDIKLPQKVKDKESYLFKSIMKKLNLKNLNSNQKVWLADRYLTYEYIDKLKYGDYTELKEELNEDIAGVKEVVEFSEFKTAKKVELKQAYTLYKKEEKFNKYISKVGYAQDTAKVGLKLLWETLPINLIIKKNTNPFEIPAIKSMQYALWQTVSIGGNIVGFDSSAELLEHSLTNKPKDLLITEGKKNNDKWNLIVELSDQYDYTDFKELDDYINDANSIPKSMFSSFIYNLAFFSVKFGVIKEYHIDIKFNIDNYEVY